MEEVILVREEIELVSPPNKAKASYEVREYTLLVDGVKVAWYNVVIKGRVAKNVTIDYSSLYANDPDSKYRHKGYVTRGLRQLTELLFNENGIYCISLSINPNNESSKKVAMNCGFIHTGDFTYLKYHPDAINIYESATREMIVKYPDSAQNYIDGLETFREYYARVMSLKEEQERKVIG